MKLTFAADRYVAVCSFDERLVPKAAGFRWDPQAKRWWTDDRAKAAKLAQFADDTCRAELEGVARAKAETLAASRATDAALDLPVPAGLSYLPYQRAGIAYAMSREATLIGDEMGLGKTIQAIGVINADPTIRRVLVICPASLKLNWKRELRKWMTRPLSIGVVYGSEWTAGDVVIVNFDILEKNADRLRAIEWDLLVVDEAHFLKNPKAKRTRLVVGHRDRDSSKSVPGLRAKRRVFLTGTPVPARPVELWPLVAYLDPRGLGANFFRYAMRYCDATQIVIGRGKTAWDFSGASNLDELQDRLRSTILVRRMKDDVLKELPPKRRQVIVLPAEGLRAAKRDRDLTEKHDAMRASLREAVDAAAELGDATAYASAVAELERGEQIMFTEISKVRHDVAVEKTPMVIEHVREALEESRKVVVFAHHHDVIDALKAGLAEYGVVSIVGGDAGADRQAAVDAFQTNPDVRVMVASILAAGVGLTLTAAAHVIFAEIDWTPANVTQAEDRCHRIGQTASLLVQHLVVDGTVDCRMAELIVEKQATSTAALDTQHEDRVEVAIRTAAEASARRAEENARRKATAMFSDDEKALLLRGLQILSGRCDGAMMEDGVGFNGTDTRWGKAVAAFDFLTDRQAEVAKKILRKYRRQLGDTWSAIYGESAA